MSFPLNDFIAKAKSEGRSLRFIESTSAYINLLNAKQLPVIFSLQHLAIEVGLRSNDIKWICKYTNSQYTYFYLVKKSGKKRLIMAPKERLKYLQRWINFNILSKLDYPTYVTGFVPKRSIINNAEIHKGSKFILSIDIENFFDSITFKEVLKVFRDIGYSNNVAYNLSEICTVEPRKSYYEKFSKEFSSFLNTKAKNNSVKRFLPQGSPCSPLLSNLVAVTLDNKLYDYAIKNNWKYSRYADDITFSSNTSINFDTALKRISRLVAQSGFRVNYEKVRLRKNGQAQYVTGLSISNNRVSIKKSKRKEIFQHLYFINRFGIEKHTQHLKTKEKYHSNYKDWLHGHILFHYSVDKQVGIKMMKEYNKIIWDLNR